LLIAFFCFILLPDNAVKSGVAPDYAVRDRYFHGEKIFMAQTLLRGMLFSLMFA